MKAVLGFGVLLAIGGCSVRGTTIQSSEDAQRLCGRRQIGMTSAKNKAGCATPENLEQLFSGDFPLSDGVEFSLGKMWDGTFPKVTKLEYRHFSESIQLGEVRPLDCTVEHEDDQKRRFACHFKDGNPYNYGKYVLSALELENERCGAQADYEPAFSTSECSGSNVGYGFERLDTFLGDRAFPDIPHAD